MTFLAALLIISVTGCSCVLSKGVPDSLSSIAYIIPKWLFSTWIMVTGMMLMPALMDVLSPCYQWMGFLMVVGLSCVAASPYYRTEQVRLHYIGAVLCFIFAMLVVWMTRPVLLWLWLAYPILLMPRTRMWLVMSAEWICLSELVLAII